METSQKHNQTAKYNSKLESQALNENIPEIDSETVKQILDRLNKITKYQYVFLRGLVSGVGTAIGATIIAGVLFAFLSQLISRTEDIPVINVIVEESNLRQFVPSPDNAE